MRNNQLETSVHQLPSFNIMIKKTIVPLTIISILFLSGCVHNPNNRLNMASSQPSNPSFNPALMGSPTATDDKAAAVEQIRQQKGTYWPGPKLTSVSSTPIDNVVAYFDAGNHIRLVDTTFTYEKVGNQPWVKMDGSMVPMPQQLSDEITKKAFNAWINHSGTIPLSFGDGSRRKFIMLSAPDCPYSKRFDDALQAASKQINATFYTSLTSAHGTPSANAMNHDTLCSSDPQSTWFGFRAGKKPQGLACSNKMLSEDRVAISTINTLTGKTNLSTPTLIAEDGSVIDVSAITESTSPEQAKRLLIQLLSNPSPAKIYF